VLSPGRLAAGRSKTGACERGLNVLLSQTDPHLERAGFEPRAGGGWLPFVSPPPLPIPSGFAEIALK
jgi:hypothetical protein